jgi:actin cytoskeleton-regulatory complex protein SLA1
MGFLGVYTALYDYQPQGENELEIQEGELLYLLEKGEDGWWKAKKKAADDEDDEPTGLIPANYVEKVGLTKVFRADPPSLSPTYPFFHVCRY